MRVFCFLRVKIGWDSHHFHALKAATFTFIQVEVTHFICFIPAETLFLINLMSPIQDKTNLSNKRIEINSSTNQVGLNSTN
jgi:hypothetical protein